MTIAPLVNNIDPTIAPIIARELDTPLEGVEAALKLLKEGNTVPFIARYRKEATGGLDDTQLRELEQRAKYLEELQERKVQILEAIQEQGKLTDLLRDLIQRCETKARLEDLYLPFKKRRKTQADTAREAGLETLLKKLLRDVDEEDAQALAEEFISQEFPDSSAVLKGVRAIVADDLSMDADLVEALRSTYYRQGELISEVVSDQEVQAGKFKDYFDYQEACSSIAAHRVLALLRGEKEGMLRLKFSPGEELIYVDLMNKAAQQKYQIELLSPWMHKAITWAWRTKLSVSAGLEVRTRLKQEAEEVSLQVFARNLHDVLLGAPAGQRPTLGLDPGYRNGVKCAVVDGTGKVVDTCIVYPHKPQARWQDAVTELAALSITHQVELIAIGNGTASRETEKLALEISNLIKEAGHKAPTPVVVSESGASVYSASEIAAQEFPSMDVSLRGAVSIARRLQDPLAELVKIDPKAIGVGQYQHDVNQNALAHTLGNVVEDAVNAVGVNVNTASVPLLAQVAGISPSIAANIVHYREEHGRFAHRKQLLDVPRLGPKAFEQCAGFLRIVDGEQALDASAVHPEAYSVATKIAQHTGLEISELIGNSRVLQRVNPNDFVDENFGLPTVRDILVELEKPGLDPRPEFVTARFKEGVETLSDVKPGMILEGTITNVAAFGAFVDIGVHQDGLVHISELKDGFVQDPHAVVQSGQVVKVRVLDVDADRKRISLSMRLNSSKEAKTQKAVKTRSSSRRSTPRSNSPKKPQGGSLADALKRAGF